MRLKPVGRPPHLAKEKKVGRIARFGRTEGDVTSKVLDQTSGKMDG